MTTSTDVQETTVPGKKILVADDDPVTLKSLSLKLKSKGYQVVTASDGSQAITATRTEHPDLMLLDIHFPPDVGGVAWNGFTITQWLQRMDECKGLPVIVMSAIDRAEYKQRASAAGAAGFLPKSVSPDELLANIDMVLSGIPIDEPTEPFKHETTPFKAERMIAAAKPALACGERLSEPAHLDIGGL